MRNFQREAGNIFPSCILFLFWPPSYPHVFVVKSQNSLHSLHIKHCYGKPSKCLAKAKVQKGEGAEKPWAPLRNLGLREKGKRKRQQQNTWRARLLLGNKPEQTNNRSLGPAGKARGRDKGQYWSYLSYNKIRRVLKLSLVMNLTQTGKVRLSGNIMSPSP